MAEQCLGYPSHFLDLWQMPSGYTLLHGEDNESVNGSILDHHKLCRGLRKNLSGRWKRMTMKKPDKVYTIPEHLRYQLKSMYVY